MKAVLLENAFTKFIWDCIKFVGGVVGYIVATLIEHFGLTMTMVSIWQKDFYVAVFWFIFAFYMVFWKIAKEAKRRNDLEVARMNWGVR